MSKVKSEKKAKSKHNAIVNAVGDDGGERHERI